MADQALSVVPDPKPQGRSKWRDRIDSIWNALSGFGNPDKDKGAAGRPAPFIPLHRSELRNLYRCNGHARRWVDVIPDEGTRKGWSVNVILDPGTDDGEQVEAEDASAGLDAMHEEDRRLRIWSRVGDAWRWARRDGGAWLFVITDEDFTEGETGDRLAEPLNPDGLRRVSNLVLLTDDDVSVASYEGDLHSEGYRQPKIYHVTLDTSGDLERTGVSLTGASVRVHASRMIYIAGATVDPRQRFENGGTDDSILQAAWDQIRNLTTIEQAGANLAQEMHLHVMKIGGLATLQAQDQLALLEGRMRLIAKSKASTGLIVMGDEEEYQTLAASVTGFREFQGTAKDALAAVAGIPQTILFGQAPGGLSTDDGAGRDQMNTLISTVQWHRLKAPLVQLYTILFAQSEGPTQGTIPDQWDLIFNPVSELSATDQAGLEKTHAETDAIRITSQVVTPEHVTQSRFGPAGYQDQLAAVPEDEDLEATAFAELERLRAEDPVALPEPVVDPEAEPLDPEAEPVEPEGDVPAEPAANTALNGAQVQAALQIVDKVVAGTLTEAMAIQMLMAFFNLDRDTAANMLAGHDTLDTPTGAQDAAGDADADAGGPSGPDDDGPPQGPPVGEDDDDTPDDDTPDDEDQPDDEG